MKKPKASASEPLSLEQFLAIRRTFMPRLSPDGKRILFVSNIGGSYNLWTVPSDGGWPTQITAQDDFIMAADWALGGSHIVYTADFQGNENTQVYLVPSSGGRPENLTGNPEVQCFLLGASPSGRQIAWSDNRREKDKFDTYVRDLKTGAEKMVLRRDRVGIDAPSDWSPDGSRLLVYRDDHNLNSNIILTSVRTPPEDFKDITPHTGDAHYFDACFSADGKRAFMIANQGSDFKNVASIGLDSREPALEWTVRARHDAAFVQASPDGRSLCYGLNVRGSIVPRMLDLKTGKDAPLGLRKGIYTSLHFSRDGRKIAYLYQGPTMPADVWTMRIPSGKPVQVTHSMAGGIDQKRLAAPREISYESPDGLKIHGLFYLPRGARKNASLPAILYPHGGPNAQNMNAFSMWFQYLMSRGYCILAPDFRGSTGYGTEFQKLIFRDWGGGDYHDLMAGAGFLRKSGWADPARVGILGMSFGGFAVLTCITRSPGAFKAAVEAYGPANLFTFIASNPPSWAEGVYALVGHPERDKDYLTERSPMNHVDQISTPLLVIQGRNDPRVAKAESDQIVESLRRRGHPVEYIVFEDEGHGFTKMKNQVTALRSTADFFDRHL